VCTISGSAIAFVSAGTCSITASQAGNANYVAATPVTQTFSVTKGGNTITFGSLPSRALGSGAFKLTATASSGLPVTYAATTTQTCSVTGSIVTLLATGQCTIVASQAGNGSYAAATPVSQTFSITKAATTVKIVSSSSSTLFHSPVTFTATVSGKSPTGMVTFKDAGTVLGVVALGRAFQASLTLSTLSVGGHSIIATYSGDANNLTSTSSAVTVAITRPNPANDPDVRGLVAAQVNAEVQFAQTQIENVIQRLESLHDENTPWFTNNIGFGGSATQAPMDASAFADAQNPLQREPGVVAIDKAIDSNSAPVKSGLRTPSFGVWTAGTVDYGSTNLLGAPQLQSNRFTTSGVTAGLDGRISSDLKVGFALGFGADRTSIGTDGTTSSGDNVSGTAYASYHPFGSFYFDSLAGYGAAQFTSSRFNPLPGIFEPGARKGSELYSALEITSEQRWNNWRFAPYMGLQFIDAELGAFTETGDRTWALSYANASMPEISSVVGLHVGYEFATSWGVLSPTLRGEYMRAFDSNAAQVLTYADTPGVGYALTVPGLGANTFSGTLGVAAHCKNGVNATLDFQMSTAGSFGKSQGLRASLNIPF